MPTGKVLQGRFGNEIAKPERADLIMVGHQPPTMGFEGNPMATEPISTISDEVWWVCPFCQRKMPDQAVHTSRECLAKDN
eukprot:g27747.t1